MGKRVGKDSAGSTSQGLTQQEEIFAVEFARTGNPSAAYTKAGYMAKSEGQIRVLAGKLLKKPAIKLRVGQLRQGAALSAKMDIEYFLSRVKMNIEQAAELGDFASSNKALELGMRWAAMIGEKVTAAPQTNVNLQLFNSGDNRADISRLANIAGYRLQAPPAKLEDQT